MDILPDWLIIDLTLSSSSSAVSVSFDLKPITSFIWLDVSLPVLFEYCGKRVDQMVEAGLVEEIREAFVHGADYSRGFRRAIGVTELDQYLKVEKEVQFDEAYKKELLKEAITRTKENTNKLAETQLGKIHRVKNNLGWELNRIEATQVFETILKGTIMRMCGKRLCSNPA
ncbi:hypothetical protein L6164_035593 [Bauhinia variegata]|uniref:Uncharacterized protein n=1 Tax=Bauhinia variegata TaxID=167791 RepID=A0ACB9KEF6_BAUVA|nr:hypothetical protein L6164_035593 [Bauhinia variegata]